MANPLVEIGKNVTFSIAPVTINGTTGALTTGTALPLTGKAKRAGERQQRRSALINALDATIDNNVHILDSWTFELSAIKWKAGTNPNPLRDTFATNPYAAITVVTSTKTYVYTGLLAEAMMNVDGPDEVLDQVTLIPIDTGSANPAIT